MKHFKIFACLLAATLFFASCDDDDDVSSLTFDPSNKVEVVEGETMIVSVKNAKGVISEPVSSDKEEEFVKVTLKSSLDASASINQISITGVKATEEGKVVSISVKDEAGQVGVIEVVVVADLKNDATTRFILGETNKTLGENDKDTYTLTQDAETGKVVFSYVSEDEKSTIELSFIDEAKELAEGAELKDAKLTVDSKDVEITDLAIIQNKVLEEGANPTIWLTFKAGEETGICVATIGAEEVTPEPEA